VHTIEKYVKYAKEQKDLGIVSLCIKDMAGILSPIRAERLVKALIKELDIPIQLHCHASSGMAMATYVEGVRAGAGAIDCAISSMAGFSSQPPVETMAAIFAETNYSAGLDIEALERVAKYFEELTPSRKQSTASQQFIDPGILIHQIPGGMISNFRSQLEMQNALDKLPDVLSEVAKVREDLGYPPLVTPTSQIVGTQAVMNVISGERYKIIPNEVKDYARGMYGRPPAKISEKYLKIILGNEKPIDYRPADKIKPMLPNATEGLEAKLIEHEEDIISYIILPEPALQFFKWRALPPEQRTDTPADLEIKKMKKEIDKEQAAVPAAEPEKTTAAPAQAISLPANFQGVAKELLEKIEGLSLEELVFRKGEFTLSVRASSAVSIPVTQSVKPAQPVDIVPPPAIRTKMEPSPVNVPTETKADYKKTINSPLVGTFYTSPGPGKPKFVNEGDKVKKGDKICIVEAMKLFNEIAAPVDCKIIKFLVNDGTVVQKDTPLVAIEEI
jgi:oxaloacetate decarboxylase alpha subunit